jgi:hypothetical protein
VKSLTEPFLNKLSAALRVPNLMANSTLLALIVSIALAAIAFFVIYLIVCIVRERLEDFKLRRRQQKCRRSYANSWHLEGFHTVSRMGQLDVIKQDQTVVRPSNITPFVLHPEEEEDAPMPKRVAA